MFVTAGKKTTQQQGNRNPTNRAAKRRKKREVVVVVLVFVTAAAGDSSSSSTDPGSGSHNPKPVLLTDLNCPISPVSGSLTWNRGGRSLTLNYY